MTNACHMTWTLKPLDVSPSWTIKHPVLKGLLPTVWVQPKSPRLSDYPKGGRTLDRKLKISWATFTLPEPSRVESYIKGRHFSSSVDKGKSSIRKALRSWKHPHKSKDSLSLRHLLHMDLALGASKWSSALVRDLENGSPAIPSQLPLTWIHFVFRAQKRSTQFAKKLFI